MTTICYNHNNNNNNWVHFNSHENQCFEDDEEEEALSLCDLPITSSSNSQQELLETISKNVENDQQDFEFGPCLSSTAIRSQDNMCNADEVFFKGQLLPLRHSVSYEKVELLTRKINRSMSDPRTMIRSNGYKPRVRNLFHSHPSPSPQIRSRTLSHSNPKSSSLWSFLQVGLVKPQEIGLSDLKNRSKRFGSHNSNSSSNSSGTNSTTDQNQNQNRHQNPKSSSKNTKKKQRLFFGGCKCSADSIERTIKEQVPKKKTTKEENMIHPRTTLLQDQGKQTVSRHRTFEWLKQLSIVAAAAPQSET